MANKAFMTISGGGIDSRSVVFDEANVPSSDQKAALAGTAGSPSGSNKFVTDTDTRLPSADQKAALAGPAGYTPSASDTYITEQYYQDKKDALDWQDSITHGIHYIKSTAGAPTGTPATGEKCLNTNENKLYVESGGSWDAGTAISSGDRFCHAFTGSDTSGDSGTHTKDNIIRTYTGTGYTTSTPNAGFAALFEDEGQRRSYNAGTTTWVLFDSLTAHNALSSIQGGDSTNRWHLSADQYNAVNAAASPSTSNPMLVKSDKTKVPVKYTFTWRNGIGQSQTRTMLGHEDIVAQHLMPKNFSIAATTIRSTHPCDAGTCDFKPAIGGTPIVNANLNLQLNTTDTNDKYGTETEGVVTGSAGALLGAQAISNASWSTTEAADQEHVIMEVMVVFS